MALADLLYILLALVLYIFLPLGLMAILLAMSRRYRGMFDEIGFSRKEMSLLIIGSLSTLLVPSEVPLVLYKNWFLAVNLGGAIIPTILSIHLLRSKKISAAVWAPGILGISAITFLFTRVQPSAGIVAEFPFMFVPALSATILSLVLFSRHSPKAPAFAYSSATLGSLIGADVFHLPELFQAAAFQGSIGGAGVFDLVYIGGLVSFALVLVFASGRLKRLQAVLPHAELARERILRELHFAATALMYGRYQLGAQRALGAVQERLHQLSRAFQYAGTFPSVLQRLLPDPAAQQGYDAIARNANVGSLDFYSARWSVLQAQALLQRLQGAERVRYAPLGRRFGAFAVDAALMTLILAAFAFAFWLGGSALASPTVLFFGLFFWAFTIQVVYFTSFEYYWRGQSPGKRLFHIRVAEYNDAPPTFITSFTRNTIRLLDFVLLGYIVSAILIQLSPRMQRLGDRVAETVVLRRRPVRTTAPPQPIYTPAA